MTDMHTKAAATADALLAHAGWMRTLALRLVGDPDAADDVVQQSFVAALQRPPRHAANLRGWLHRVVTNRARERGRGEGRRAARERLGARDEALPSTDELVVEAEAQRELVSAVLRLDEPYRSTILLRFYRDLSPKEIAAREGTPAATVRSRIMRGLAMLRADLDRRHEGDRRAWCTALAPLASGAAVATFSVQAKLALGGVAAALVAWLGTTFLVPDAPDPVLVDPVATADDEVQLLPIPASRGEERVAEVADEAIESSGSGPVAAVTELTGSYVGTVVDPAGDPVEGASLRILPKDRGNWHELEPLAIGTSAADGTFSIPVPTGIGEDRYLLIAAEAEGHSSLSMDPVVPEHEIAIRLEWTTSLHGVVVDEETGTPIEGVRVTQWKDPATTGADGSFVLPGLIVGKIAELSLHHDEYAYTTAKVVAATRKPVERTLPMERGVPVVIDLVDRATGGPVVGARVGPAYRPPIGTTDADGRIEMRARKGETLPVTVEADGFATLRWGGEIHEDFGRTTYQLPMIALGVIEGRLTDADGGAIAGAHLGAYCEDHFRGFDLANDDRAAFDVVGRIRYEVPRDANRPTDEHGGFELPVVPGEHSYVVSGGSRELVPVYRKGVFVRSPRERIRLDLVQSAGGTIEGEVLCSGKAPRDAWVVAERDGHEPSLSRIDTDGRYRIGVLMPGTYTVKLMDRGHGSVLGTVPDPVEVTVAAGEASESDFVWDVEMSSIAGVVRNTDGTPADDAHVFVRSEDESERRAHYSASTTSGGTFRVDVPPGRTYSVTSSRRPVSDGRKGVHAGAEDLAFVLPDVGVIRFRMIDADSGDAILPDRRATGDIGWRLEGQSRFRPMPPHDTEADVVVVRTAMPAGGSALADLDLNLAESGYVSRRVTGVPIVREDADAEPTTIELRRGLSCTIDAGAIEPYDVDDRRGHLVFALADGESDAIRGPFLAQGGASNHRINGINVWLREPGLMHRMLRLDESGRAKLNGLRPGRYTWKVLPEGLTVEPATFTVIEDGTRIEVVLRR